MGVGALSGGDALLVSGIQPSVADVVHDGAGEQVGVLEHRPQGAAQVVLADGLHIDAVIGDESSLDLIEAVDQVGDGGLARAGGAYEGDLLARVGVDGHIFQDAFAGHIGEVHMAEPDGPLQLGEVVVLPGHVAHGAPDQVEGGLARVVLVLPGPAVAGQGGQVGHFGEPAVRSHLHPDALGGVHAGRQQLQAAALGPLRLAQLGEGILCSHQHGDQRHGRGPWSLPGPDTGPACAVKDGQGAVGVLLRPHQGDGPLVHLGLGVHHLKDPLGARQGGEEGGHLLGDLVQGLAHLLGVVEIDHQAAQVKALDDRQQSAECGGEGVADVHQVARHGHNHGGVEVGLLCRVPVGLIELAELILGLLLVGEGLDHLQPLDDLLDVAVHVAQGCLLLLIEAAAAPAQLVEQHHGERQHQGGDQEQLPVDEKHHGHQAHEHQAAGAHGDHALLQGQLHVVRVVGEAAHQLAVGVLVKVGQRQILQFVEQVLAQPVDPPLGQPHHNGGLSVGGRAADEVDAYQDQDGPAQAGEVGAARPDEVVDDAPHHVGATDVGEHRDQQASEHGHQGQLAAGEITQQPGYGLAQILGLLIAPPGGAIGSRHYSPTPSC